MLTAIDEGSTDSVYVMSVEDGADIAGMGGLMGTAMAARGYAGAVIDGGVRDVAYLRKIGFPAADIETAKFWHGPGCEECRHLGYQGRQGIYELLLLNEQIRPLILGRAAASTIASKAIELGMRTLRTDGWNKVKNGETTIEEILRVTQIEEHMDAMAERHEKK